MNDAIPTSTSRCMDPQIMASRETVEGIRYCFSSYITVWRTLPSPSRLCHFIDPGALFKGHATILSSQLLQDVGNKIRLVGLMNMSPSCTSLALRRVSKSEASPVGWHNGNDIQDIHAWWLWQKHYM